MDVARGRGKVYVDMIRSGQHSTPALNCFLNEFLFLYWVNALPDIVGYEPCYEVGCVCVYLLFY